ncbi:hypothetical protein MRB53_014305 [Persea americana]|uniref:Uncharacterized protein n=1 Tax=Persea americana TaxID=3435 RepID=A0ACC2KB00_PERAE|nr:hypothetical protein MRB53_014305 [Persea americana]
MILVKPVLSFFAVTFSILRIHASSISFTPSDNYLIACGSRQNIAVEGQIFLPDSHQSSFMLKSEGESAIASSNSTAPPVYRSLRLFTKPSSYKFSIQRQGWHWIRLYFHPLPNSGHDLYSAPITAITEKFVLLNNFTFNNQKSSYLFREYMINVTSTELTINFLPLKNSVSFVNGIEVVSVPDDLIPDSVYVLSSSRHFEGLSERGLETVFRLNMGGPLITPQNDTLGRTWENDQKYLNVPSSVVNVSVDLGNIRYKYGVTAETAPNVVYATADVMPLDTPKTLNFNLSWVFSVDSTFVYFIRLHFCDIVSKVNNELIFNVYINSENAVSLLDLSAETGGLGQVPYYMDFVSNSSTNSNRLVITIGPDNLSSIATAILNGLEIMKISSDKGSLDGKFSVDDLLPTSHSKESKMRIVIEIVVGALAMLGLIVSCCCYFVVHRSRASTQPYLHGSSMASLELGRVFSFQEIKDSTNDFSESLLLGVGGFGKVYKGILEDGTRIAAKRGDRRAKQGLAEFRNELEMLSKLRHRTFGYLDPEYFRWQQLREKSDVYSFGVVLMEVLCGRPALDPDLSTEQVNVAEWALSWQEKGILEHVIDPALVGKINPASLRIFGEIAEKCLAELGVNRPTMADVSWNLEYLLQLEEAPMFPVVEENNMNHVSELYATAGTCDPQSLN